MIRILVTGAGGQLGLAIKELAPTYSHIDFVFTDKGTLDICDPLALDQMFRKYTFTHCINCAAFTDVEQAEKTPDRAFEINAEGVKKLALACRGFDTILLHISTDYVFDGTKKGGYTIHDRPNPINAYGASKLKGELYIQEILERYLIIRTSWLYSQKGTNFYTRILEKARKGETLKVIDTQIGCPTKAINLARFLLGKTSQRKPKFGVYHFTDGVAMTWFEFARSILQENGLEDMVRLEKAKNYRTFAARPANSVLQ